MGLEVKHRFPYSGIQFHLRIAESSVAFVPIDKQVTGEERQKEIYVFEKALICHFAS